MLGGPLSPAIMDTNDKLLHAITLWGIEYEGDTVSSLRITDSDDYLHQLRQIAVNQKKQQRYYHALSYKLLRLRSVRRYLHSRSLGH